MTSGQHPLPRDVLANCPNLLSQMILMSHCPRLKLRCGTSPARPPRTPVLPPMTGPSMWNTFATHCGDWRAIKPLDQPVGTHREVTARKKNSGQSPRSHAAAALPGYSTDTGLYVVGADHRSAFAGDQRLAHRIQLFIAKSAV